MLMIPRYEIPDIATVPVVDLLVLAHVSDSALVLFVRSRVAIFIVVVLYNLHFPNEFTI